MPSRRTHIEPVPVFVCCAVPSIIRNIMVVRGSLLSSAVVVVVDVVVVIKSRVG